MTKTGSRRQSRPGYAATDDAPVAIARRELVADFRDIRWLLEVRAES
jgi:hypothetical protein